MNINIEEYDLYIKPGATDLRKRAESLSFLIRNEMGLDPLEKSIFIFCSKNKKRIVAIVWNGNGWLEITKKLECYGGRYCWPNSEKETKKVSIEDIKEMWKGGNPWRRFSIF